MKRAFLIARQEFIKYVTRRGFAISILMFPLWIMIVIFVPQWTGGGGDSDTRHHVFTVVDRSGGVWRDALYCAAGLGDERRQLKTMAHYAAAYVDGARLQQTAPAIAAMLRHPDWQASLAAYHALSAGRAPTPAPDPALCVPNASEADVIAALAVAKKPGAPEFSTNPLDLATAAAPDYLLRAQGAAFPAAVRRVFATEREPGLDYTPLVDAVIVIPRDFGKNGAAAAQIWTNGRPDRDFRAFVADTLTQALRFAQVRAAAPQLNDPSILEASVEIQSRDPSRAVGGNATVDSIVPIALAVILFVVSVMNASVLLQGVVEEKSTRMIEVLLSCATPREITTGKLIGVIAVALTTLLIWALALFALMAIASHDTVALVFSSLRATASLDTLPLLLVFFLCGLLIYGSLFLAIGSMANSLADAQALLGPSMLILMLPNLMISGVMQNPNGPLASGLSWVPIYTPFFMMLRIASHPPAWQLWGTLALAVTTAALLIWWTGRVFAKHVLTTERPPALGKLIASIFRR